MFSGTPFVLKVLLSAPTAITRCSYGSWNVLWGGGRSEGRRGGGAEDGAEERGGEAEGLKMASFALTLITKITMPWSKMCVAETQQR